MHGCINAQVDKKRTREQSVRCYVHEYQTFLHDGARGNFTLVYYLLLHLFVFDVVCLVYTHATVSRMKKVNNVEECECSVSGFCQNFPCSPFYFYCIESQQTRSIKTK